VLSAIFKREFSSYFSTPLAFVFVVIFLMLTGVFTFHVGHFFENGQADLLAFFNFHPWLYLFLIPALAMRLWAEERKSDTIEVLLTLPVRLRDAVVGKFLAAWSMCGFALILTFPMWITVNFLGEPDNGVIFASYLGSWLMAGSFLAIGSCFSAVTSNQVIAFILSVVVCFFLVVAGSPLVLSAFQGWVPLWFLDAINALSLLSHFHALSRGVVALRDVLFFFFMIAAWLTATAVIIDMKKAD